MRNRKGKYPGLSLRNVRHVQSDYLGGLSELCFGSKHELRFQGGWDTCVCIFDYNSISPH